MKNLPLWARTLILAFLVFNLSGCKEGKSEEKTRTTSFDQEWRFIKANPESAESPDFDDSDWRTLDLPHDWSIEDLPEQNGETVIGPFSKASVGKMGTGFTVGGTAWYRKHFTIDETEDGKTAYLQFDGVYMNADVWINGKHVGNHLYGYTSFWYDISSYLNPAGKSNVIAVQVKNEGKNARWYSGSGIYRHTWLTLVNEIHVAPWGVFVSTPEVTETKATVNIETTVNNSGNTELTFTCLVNLLDPSGKKVGKTAVESKLKAGESIKLTQEIEVINPELWSLETPNLYNAEVEIIVNNSSEDKLITPFGIRTLEFSPETGFTLNDKNILLRGGCFHHDNGPLGSAAIDRAEERKIEILKNAGFNAIRCSHNPPSPYLLDVCDRLGMLVIDEFADMWERPKVSPDDYSKYFKTNWKNDLGSILMRDRNHPSIIMWSIGNEIGEAGDSTGFRIARNLVDEVKKYDLTRPATEAVVDMSLMGGKSWEDKAPHLAMLDVIGYNYGHLRYEDDHLKYPDRIGYTSEFNPPLSLQNWQKVEELPYVIGNFSWTAMDYIGEAGTGVPRLVDIKPNETIIDPRQEIASRDLIPALMVFFGQESWPMVVNFQGDIDLIGNPKVPYYYQHVVWRDLKVSMFVHKPIPEGKREVVSRWGFPDELKSWNWEGHEGEKMQVHVYTRSKKVRLELNGKVIGEQTIDDSKSITATFEVPYEPGTLTAYCFNDGNEIASESIKTVGKPFAIRLKADRTLINADRNDLSYVMVEIVDEAGNVVPNADDIWVNFEISGNGEIAGVGNGNHSDLSSFQQPKKKTWQGRCLAIVRPLGNEKGKSSIIASAEGLVGSELKIIME